MLGRRHRLALHALGAVALAGVAVVATGGTGQAAGTAKPGSYDGDATAAVFEYRLDKTPAPFPVNDPFHVWFPYAETSIDSSGGATGLAGSVYPGQGVLGVGALLCQFNAQFCQQVISRLPSYPLLAQAQYPTHPDDTAGANPPQTPLDAGPFSISAHDLTAHADPDLVTANAVTSANSVADVLSADSADAHSKQAFKDGALLLSADSVVRGLTIGGVVHIDQVASTASATINGIKAGTATATTTLSGATVNGTPVTIDSSGVHVAGSDNAAVVAAVNAALSKLDASGISVRMLGVTKQAGVNSVTASTGGLLVTYEKPIDAPSVPQLPVSANGTYYGLLTIGGAGVQANAGHGDNLVTAPVTTPTATGGTTTTTGGSTAAAPPPAAGGETTTTAGTPGNDPTLATPPTRQAAGIVKPDLTYKRLRTLMLALLAYPLLVLLSAPLRSPARLPRNPTG